MEQNCIKFTAEVFVDFIKARNKAVLQEKEIFMFQENEISVSYANYLIAYVSIMLDLEVKTTYISKN